MKGGKTRRRRPSQRSSCDGKVAHDERRAKSMAAYMRSQGKLMHAYRCLFCHLPSGTRAWHVGH